MPKLEKGDKAGRHCKGSGAAGSRVLYPGTRRRKGYSASVIWLCFHYILHLAIKQFERKFTKLAAETASKWRRKLIEFMQVEHLHTRTHTYKKFTHIQHIYAYISLYTLAIQLKLVDCDFSVFLF